MRRNKIILLKTFILFITISILFLIPTNAKAQEITSEVKVAIGVIDPGDFEPPALTDDDTELVTSKAATIVDIIRIIGIIVTVVTLMLIGIKYMTGSLEEKADYKKSMIPYLIGVGIFFALSQLLAVIMKIAEGFNV